MSISEVLFRSADPEMWADQSFHVALRPVESAVSNFIHGSLRRQLQRYLRMQKTVDSELTLTPNKGQTLMLGKYSFGLASQPLTIGVAAGIYMTKSPSVSIRTKRIITNAPSVGFVTISTILIANVAVTVGGVEDAYTYSAKSFVPVDYPTLTPSQKATFSGNYSGKTRRPYAAETPFRFCIGFFGPASITQL